MIKTVECPTGCGAKIVAEFSPRDESVSVHCTGCKKRIWVPAANNLSPKVFNDQLDPRAEAIFAEHLPNATGSNSSRRQDVDERIRLTF